MPAISISVGTDIIYKLEKAAQATSFPKSKIVEKALDYYFKNITDDADDVLQAELIAAEIDSGRMKTFSADEIKKELGLI